MMYDVLMYVYCPSNIQYMANIYQDGHSIRNIPQIIYALLACVRPTNVGFSNRFFCLSDKRFLNIIIKNFFEEDKS